MGFLSLARVLRRITSTRWIIPRRWIASILDSLLALVRIQMNLDSLLALARIQMNLDSLLALARILMALDSLLSLARIQMNLDSLLSLARILSWIIPRRWIELSEYLPLETSP